MVDYPDRGDTPWDLTLKDYVDSLVTLLATDARMTQVTANPDSTFNDELALRFAEYIAANPDVGTEWFAVIATPSPGLGVIGDWALDTVTGDTWKKISGSGWVFQINLMGPVGPTGPTGATGPPGETGPTGADSTVPGPGGDPGRGIDTVVRTTGTGAPGTTDIYTITYSDTTTSTFSVYNGVDGAGAGDVIGPATATDNAVARFDLATGKLIQDSNVTISDTGDIATPGTVDGRDVATDGTKLDGIATGATANSSDATLLDRDNHTGTQPAATVTGLAAVATSGSASDITTGTLPNAVLPPLAITVPFAVATQAAMLALTAQQGDVAIRSDLNKSFILSTNSPGTLGDWLELLTPTDTVLSVAGKTGVVSLVKADVGLGSVDDIATGTTSGTIPVLGAGGRLDIARLGSGTPDGTKFVRDDGTLATPAGGGGGATLLNRVTVNSTATASYVRNTTTTTDINATDLANTFTPTTSSVRVLVKIPAIGSNASNQSAEISLRNGSTNIAGTERIVTLTDQRSNAVYDVTVTGLTPGTPLTWKLAGRSGTGGTFTIYYGGSTNEFNTGGLQCFGPIEFEVWTA